MLWTYARYLVMWIKVLDYSYSLYQTTITCVRIPKLLRCDVDNDGGIGLVSMTSCALRPLLQRPPKT